ncbi:MAG: FHA domain-containing protein [Planctomycetota bacterium]|jgi:hypothetical protein
MLRLVITTSAGESLFETERHEVLLGRREGVDLVLPEPAASHNHCLLRVERDGVRLIDLGTVNGTLVAGRKVAQAFLKAGQEFRVGGTTVCIDAYGSRAGAAAAPPPRLELEEDPEPPPGVRAPVAPAAPAADFGREIRAVMRSAPWYMVSLVVHIVALLLLDYVAFKVTVRETAPVLAALDPTRAELPEDLNEGIEPDLEDLRLELEPIPEEPEDEPVSRAIRKDPLEAEFDLEDVVPPDRLGVLGGRRRLKKLDVPLPRTSVKGGDEQIDKGDLQGEQGRATESVKRDLGRGIREARRRLARHHVVVVQGSFDKIEKILDLYEWPYTLIEYKDLALRSYPRAKLLFINCGRSPGHAHRKKLVSVVKNFITRGGWVVTSDWSIEPYLTAAFPDRVRVIEPKRRQPNTTITVHPHAQDRLLEGVFSHRARSAWWLEDSSKFVKVTGRVRPLVTSAEMQRRYGAEVVVFEFHYGKGRVIHLLGHFYQKDGNRMGLVGMHRLINNVILARTRPRD